MPEGERRLAAIMFTDIVGYTSLTQKDEALAMELLEEQRRLVRPFFPRHNGKEVKTIGDAFLVEFGSALEAVRCAFDIQQSLHEANSGRPVETKFMLRIGVHLGDVIHSQGDVYGDAVNLASRIEPLALPGGVCVTEQVHDQIRNKSDFQLVSIGRKELKNVGEAVEVFRIVFPWERHEAPGTVLDKKRIAVLPFANLSSDPEEGYFADGMTEELITSLSSVRQLTVIARTSVMKYKGSPKGASEVGKELNAGSLIEGSVRKAGSRVRITAQLIDAATEGHLWAQNYDRQLEDIFAIQSEIAEKVAGELKIRLVDSEKRVIEKKATENTEAYTYYLRGRELVREGTQHSLTQAVGLFEKATALDPSFAKAYVGLAECFLLLLTYGHDSYERVIPKAELALTKAIQLDPELAEAHAGSCADLLPGGRRPRQRSRSEAGRGVESQHRGDVQHTVQHSPLERRHRRGTQAGRDLLPPGPGDPPLRRAGRTLLLLPRKGERSAFVLGEDLPGGAGGDVQGNDRVLRLQRRHREGEGVFRHGREVRAHTPLGDLDGWFHSCPDG